MLPAEKVTELPTLKNVRGVPDLRSTAGERAADVNRRLRVIAKVLVAPAGVLKTRFIQQRQSEYRGLGHLKIMKCRFRVERALRQRETADAAVLRIVLVEVVANHQRVPIIQLIIKTRADIQRSSRHEHAESEIQRIQIRTEHGRRHQRIVIDFLPLDIQKERGLLGDERAAY